MIAGTITILAPSAPTLATEVTVDLYSTTAPTMIAFPPLTATPRCARGLMFLREDITIDMHAHADRCDNFRKASGEQSRRGVVIYISQ